MTMKINFDWHNFMSNNTEKTSQTMDDSLKKDKNVKGIGSVHKQTIVDISEKVTDDFTYGDQGKVAEKIKAAMSNEDYLAVQRDFMTVMSNSMSASDFQKIKEEGFDLSHMEPDQVVTILDKIKTVLAQAGTQIKGYNDNLSVDKITEITGNTGYAETIAKELTYADAPVTEENIKQIDEVVDQALTMEVPKEGSLAYMVSRNMEPTIANLYKAEHSSVNVNKQKTMTGYASNAYSKQGTDTAGIRKTSVSKEDYQQIEKQIKARIENDGVAVNEKSLESGKWLLEKGLPVTGENVALLQEIKELTFPLDIKQVIKQAAQAIGEGKSPFQVNLNKKDDGIYKEACRIYDRYHRISFQAVDYAQNNHLECSLKNLESYDPKLGYSVPQMQARKTLEEVRLKMTVEANMKLLKSGYDIETAPMEDFIEQLEKATRAFNENLWGKEDSAVKANLYTQTREYIRELPTLPISVVGKIPFMEKPTLENVVQEGKLLQQKFEQLKTSYETVMTAPRADLGDSIKKAFRNVDDILQDMNLEVNEANRRAIRIMGYNQITITEENLTKIKEADSNIRELIYKMKPAMTMEMIREGKNPLQMSLEELQSYVKERENDFVKESERYSQFLYKLEKSKDITEAERDAYIGVYRLFRQIEKSDGAVIGSLISQNADLNFSNLLSAVRTRKAGSTNFKVDDSTELVMKVHKKDTSISEQIEKGIASIQESLALAKSTKTADQVLEHMQTIEEDDILEKQLIQNQLEEIRQTVKQVGKEKDFLQMYHQPVTLDNLQSAMFLNQKRGNAFKKVIELEEHLPGQEISDEEREILNKAQDFLTSLDHTQDREKSYDDVISQMKQVLETTVEHRSTNYVDVKELQSIYKQISVAGNLSKEENYEIPVRLGEEVTSINLKIVQGKQDRREVKITFQTENFGHVEARFVDTEFGLEGSVLTDYMDGKMLLENHQEDLTKAVTEVLKDTKTQLKSLFFGVNEKLDISSVDKKVRERDVDVSLLYKVAKEFIYYVKGIKEA